jgi:aspartyl-tRNA(Asn)/glutamyl-tRNA(Gln) amidotransferase subunit A
MQPYCFSIHELLRGFAKKEISPGEVIESLKKRIIAVDPRVKAYVRFSETQSLTPETLLSEPRGRQSSSAIEFLHGIPITIKDNICTEGYFTECCSKILQGFQPPYDATVIRKLKAAGAIILDAKANMDEFAFGSSTENSYFGPTHNPWDLSCVAGGSSGGSAAAVAADEAIAALGSDTGGSIRQPASFCGVVGLKPTYGRVSRFGLIAFASSLDQIGPITKTVADNALVLNAIAGYDPNDSTSADVPLPDFTQALDGGVKGLKIGIPKEYFVEGLDPEVKGIITQAVEQLKSLGAQTKEVSLGHSQYAVPVYYIIATAEASSNLARFDGVAYGYRAHLSGIDSNRLIEMYRKTRGEGFGEEAKRRIILGTFALSHGYYDAYYLRALKVRTLIKNDFDEVFKGCDCIVTPTSPTTAFKIGEKIDDPLQMYLSDIYTISANLSGVPAISIPCGFIKQGLPVGLQIFAKPFDEGMLFRVGHAYEQKTQWHKQRPKLG